MSCIPGYVQGAYISLGICKTESNWIQMSIVVGLVALLLGGNWAYKASNRASVTRKRHRALQELEKTE